MPRFLFERIPCIVKDSKLELEWCSPETLWLWEILNDYVYQQIYTIITSCAECVFCIKISKMICDSCSRLYKLGKNKWTLRLLRHSYYRMWDISIRLIPIRSINELKQPKVLFLPRGLNPLDHSGPIITQRTSFQLSSRASYYLA